MKALQQKQRKLKERQEKLQKHAAAVQRCTEEMAAKVKALVENSERAHKQRVLEAEGQRQALYERGASRSPLTPTRPTMSSTLPEIKRKG